MLFYPKWAEPPPILKNLVWNNIVNIWCHPETVLIYYLTHFSPSTPLHKEVCLNPLFYPTHKYSILLKITKIEIVHPEIFTKSNHILRKCKNGDTVEPWWKTTLI